MTSKITVILNPSGVSTVEITHDGPVVTEPRDPFVERYNLGERLDRATRAAFAQHRVQVDRRPESKSPLSPWEDQPVFIRDEWRATIAAAIKAYEAT